MSRTSKHAILSNIGSIVQKIIESTSNDDAVTHDQLLININALQLAVETPLETIYRIGHQPWQDAALRIAIDLGIFSHLVEAGDDGIDAQSLAQKTGAEAILITRLVRVLQAMGLCNIKEETYTANSKTEILTQEQGLAACKFWFDISMPTATKLPEYFRTHGYSNPEKSVDSAFAYTFRSEFWAWMSTHPENSAVFNSFMASRRKGRPTWFNSYPVKEQLIQGLQGDLDAVALVDVGGNRGHDLIKLKNAYPELDGKLVLQDLPEVISKSDISELGTIKTMEHDFFKPQPILGARAYHFRAIFHDWPDHQCKQILQQTASSMKAGYSKLLISEFILSDHNTRLFPASLDMQMMGLHAGSERSYRQWKALLDSAGLSIVKVWQELEGGEGVIEAVLKCE